jgi:hypothetical protein
MLEMIQQGEYIDKDESINGQDINSKFEVSKLYFFY